MLNRRGFLTGVASLIVAPAVVRAESLMPLWVPRPVLLGGTSSTYRAPALTIGDIVMWASSGWRRFEPVPGRLSLPPLGIYMGGGEVDVKQIYVGGGVLKVSAMGS